jgi:hypothetical protein
LRLSGPLQLLKYGLNFICRTTEKQNTDILKELTARVKNRKADEATKVKMREQEEADLKPIHAASHNDAPDAATGAAPAASGAAAGVDAVPGETAQDIALKMEQALEKSDAMSSAPVAPPVYQELVVQLPVSALFQKYKLPIHAITAMQA